ncbi:MAG: sulfatase-like hydrolase/transferase, partial [Bacteroidota bacterium]|nr:sulfatase-like hydrolase/transferase [Bacteroidota bacterium]
MKRLFFIFLALQILIGCETPEVQSDTPPPNIILVITDDQGYGDLGIHGNPFIRTPVLDSLARVSTRIDPFYVSPVCAPTRSSLMTGRDHLRTGVYDTYNGGAMMAPGEITVAEVLAENGYHTAMVGKWHLGDSYPMRPMDQGFQYYLAHKGGGIGQPGDDFGNFMRPDSSYFDPYLWENGERVRRKGYCSDVFTDQAIEFIQKHSSEQASEPFFLY